MLIKMNKIEKANIARIRDRLSEYVAMAERGKTVVVCRRNKPVAERVGAAAAEARNRTRLGSAPGGVIVKCDLTAPAMPRSDWDVLR